MILTFRPIKVWPPGWQDANRDYKRAYSRFDASHSQTLDLLDRETYHLQARSVYLQVAASDRDCRLDGQLRANAKVDHPGVILTIETRNLGTLVYATDRFRGTYKTPGWQSNLRAIALGLEALRKIERYGIAERGQQYAGYRELPPGAILLGSRMTVEDAAAFILEHCGNPDRAEAVEWDPLFALTLYKDAAKRLHPDVGGDEALFKRLNDAKRVLEEAGGLVA